MWSYLFFNITYYLLKRLQSVMLRLLIKKRWKKLIASCILKKQGYVYILKKYLLFYFTERDFSDVK